MHTLLFLMALGNFIAFYNDMRRNTFNATYFFSFVVFGILLMS